MLVFPTLVDELARFRTEVPRYQRIIKRWRSFAGTNKLWNDIQGAARRHNMPPLDVNEFVNVVLSATWSTARLIERDKLVKAEFEKLKREIIQSVKWANSPVELGRALNAYEERIFALSKNSYNFNSPPISRKNQNGSRDRIASAHRVGGYLERFCGERRDEQVALLTSIAFSVDEVTVDKVRLARRASTKAGRKSKA